MCVSNIIYCNIKKFVYKGVKDISPRTFPPYISLRTVFCRVFRPPPLIPFPPGYSLPSIYTTYISYQNFVITYITSNNGDIVQGKEN